MRNKSRRYEIVRVKNKRKRREQENKRMREKGKQRGERRKEKYKRCVNIYFLRNTHTQTCAFLNIFVYTLFIYTFIHILHRHVCIKIYFPTYECILIVFISLDA